MTSTITLPPGRIYIPEPDKMEVLPWVFVHGFWSHCDMFEYWRKKAEKMNIHTDSVQLTGHSRSSKPCEVTSLTTQDYLRDVLRTINKIGDCIIIGQSYGAILAVLAANKSDLIQKAVLVNSSPHTPELLRLDTILRSVKYWGAMYRGDPTRLNEYDARALLFNAFEPGEQRVQTFDLVHESGTALKEVLLGQITIKPAVCDVLVVGSELDVLVPPKIQRRVAKLHDAEYLEIPQACHMAMLQPGIRDEMFDMIADWVCANRN